MVFLAEAAGAVGIRPAGSPTSRVRGRIDRGAGPAYFRPRAGSSRNPEVSGESESGLGGGLLPRFGRGIEGREELYRFQVPFLGRAKAAIISCRSPHPW